MTEQGRRTALAVAGIVLAAFLALVVTSVRGGSRGDNGRSETDGAFIVGMVPHHTAAVEMAQMALDRSEHREVKRLAQDIVDSQIEEIGVLRAIHVRLYGAPLSSMSGDHGAMPGMSAEMGATPAELNAAPEFDRAFLDAMVPHHQGAIAMAKQEVAKGRDSELRRIARRIIEAQTREIAKMQTWRKEWYGAR